MFNPAAGKLLISLVAELDVPDSAYEAAERRYKDVAEWFARPGSHCHPFSPHIYPQGSFRLGTVLRPVIADERYDVDLGCRLRTGLSKSTITQKSLKELVGSDLRLYRDARGIKQQLEEKPRCWRLNYADQLSFHMDAVPSIPETADERRMIQEAMTRAGSDVGLAGRVAALSGSITDNRLASYAQISDQWRISNAEGFALWFESRMRLAQTLVEERLQKARAAKIDNLPANKWKTPLQACVQILKRHRDVMFAASPAHKPISVIITTLAARSYNGETDLLIALDGILARMGNFVSATVPRIPNPVNPAEDFADKWWDPKYAHLTLEQNFWHWLTTARADLGKLTQSTDSRAIVEGAKKSMGVTLPPASGGAASLLSSAAVPSVLSFPPKPIIPSKPAGFA